MIVHGENAAELFKAFATAQAAFNAPKKDRQGYGYKYADMAAVIASTNDALTSNGLAIVQGASTNMHNGGILVTVETMLLHESGTYLQFPPLSMVPKQADPQGIGSAITYARRYAYLAAVGIAPEDDDGEAASGNRAQASQHKPAQRNAKPAPKKAAGGAQNGKLPNSLDDVAEDSAGAMPHQAEQPTDPAWKKAHRRLNAVGGKMYGGKWESVRHAHVLPTYGVATSNAMTVKQLTEAADKIQVVLDRKNAKATQDGVDSVVAVDSNDTEELAGLPA